LIIETIQCIGRVFGDATRTVAKGNVKFRRWNGTSSETDLLTKRALSVARIFEKVFITSLSAQFW